MSQAPMKRSPWVWVSLGCIGIVAILGIIVIVFTSRLLKSPEFQSMKSAMEKTESLSTVVAEASAGLEKYVTEKGDFPANVDQLKGYMPDISLGRIKTEMKYTKPAKDAPPETIVLTTGVFDLMSGATQEIIVQKDFKFLQLTRSPLEKK